MDTDLTAPGAASLFGIASDALSVTLLALTVALVGCKVVRDRDVQSVRAAIILRLGTATSWLDAKIKPVPGDRWLLPSSVSNIVYMAICYFVAISLALASVEFAAVALDSRRLLVAVGAWMMMAVYMFGTLFFKREGDRLRVDWRVVSQREQ